MVKAAAMAAPKNIEQLWVALQAAFWDLDPDKLDNIAEAKTTECVQIMEADGWQVNKEAHAGYRTAKRRNGGAPVSLSRELEL